MSIVGHLLLVEPELQKRYDAFLEIAPRCDWEMEEDPAAIARQMHKDATAPPSLSPYDDDDDDR